MENLGFALEFAILVAILTEIFLGWKWHKELRKWHQEEMKQWFQEVQNKKEAYK